MGSHSWSPVCDSIFLEGGNLGCTALLEEVVGGRLRELITYNSLQFLLCDVSWEYDLCVPGTCHLLLCLPAMMDSYPLEQQVKTNSFYPQLLLVTYLITKTEKRLIQSNSVIIDIARKKTPLRSRQQFGCERVGFSATSQCARSSWEYYGSALLYDYFMASLSSFDLDVCLLSGAERMVHI